MSKNLAKVILILLVVSSQAGCWSRLEVEDLAFATLVALDKAAESQIELSVQFAITANGGDEGSGGDGAADAPVWTVNSVGNNLAGAIENMQTFTGKYPFWAHTRVIIIGEELARSGIASVLDYFMRNREFRFSTWVMVSEGPAKDLLAVTPKLSQLPAELVAELNRVTSETSISTSCSLIELFQLLVEEHASEPILPLITVHQPADASQASPEEVESGDTSDKADSLSCSGLAVFSGDKMIAKLDADEARGLLWLRGETKRSTLVIDVPGQGYLVQGQIYGRRTLRVTRAGDALKAKITIYQDGDLKEHDLKQFELNADTIKEMNNLLSAHIQAIAEEVLQKTQQELKTDVIGIGERVYRLYPKLYQSLNWQEYFPTMPIEVEVHASFRRTGEMLQSPLTGKYRSD